MAKPEWSRRRGNEGSISMKLCVACWWLTLAAFAVSGVIVWTRFFVPAAPVFHDKDAALDAMARTRFGMDDGASTLRGEVAGFSPDASLLVFGRGDDWTLTEAHFLISYLAWPRPVWCIGVMPPGQRAKYDYPPPPGLHPAALFFYKVAPPPGMSARQLSSNLAIQETPP
jgi:hypothetical protein